MPTITKSIGTTGRDYSTITLWEADLDNGAVYTAGDDAVGECYDDSAFDEIVTLNGGGTIGLNSCTLSVAAGERHDGTAGTGARIVRTGTGTVLSLIPFAAGTRKLVVEWLEINCNGQAILVTVNNAGATAGRIPVLQRMILHDSVNSAANFKAINGQGRDILVQNNIVYDYVSTNNNRETIGIELDSDNANGGCFNNTVYKMIAHGTGIATGIMIDSDDADSKTRNNISVGHSNNPVAFDFPATIVNILSSNNLSDDATADDGGGTGHLINQNPAYLFVSTTNGSEDFHLAPGSPAINAGVDLGTTPTGVNLDIDGYDRDAGGDVWDIGADESPHSPIPPANFFLLGVG